MTADFSQIQSDPERERGRPWRGWREGEFDVHLIDIGIAEASFYVFPDGTTALVDCGDRNASSRGSDGFPARPDATRRPGEWVARYISRVRPGIETLDYLIATHFHKDHVGSWEYGAGTTRGRGEDYRLSGLAQVGEFYRFGAAFDRGYPRYEELSEKSRPEAENLRRFLDYHERRFGLRRDAFRVGAANQIRTTHVPGRYDFETRNVCGCGRIWTGRGEESVDVLGRLCGATPRSEFENTQSLGVLFRYGAFRFFAGGDVKNVGGVPEEEDFETQLARVLGRVDACKANHHAGRGSATRAFTSVVRAQAYLVNVWQRKHLQRSALEATTEFARVVCATQLSEEHCAAADSLAYGNRLARDVGHVVLKAYEGGALFKVYSLSSEDESMRVNAVYGPFRSYGTEDN